MLGSALRASAVEALDLSCSLHTALSTPPPVAPTPTDAYGASRGGDGPQPFPSSEDDAYTTSIVAAFAPMLRATSLLELRASQCRLGDKAMVLLCLHLRAARCLSLLDVSLNCFQAHITHTQHLVPHVQSGRVVSRE